MPRGKKSLEVDSSAEKVGTDGSIDSKKKETSAKESRKKVSEGAKANGSSEKKDGKSRKKTTDDVIEADAELVKKGGVGGNGNLIPLNQRTKGEQREICSKAGVASGIARRRKKELREFTKDFLLQDAAPVLQNNMKVLGVESDDMTNLSAIVVRLFNKAVNQGDLNSARTLIEWAGMAPLQQERENEAIAKMSQVMQLAGGNGNSDSDEETSVIFYLPDNGRSIITDDLVGVSEAVE